MTHPTRLRAAEANSSDGAVFARYLDEAADGLFAFLLGSGAEQVLARAFLVESHNLSYENVTLAELDGSIVGMVSGFTAAQYEQHSDRVLRQAAGLRTVRMYAIGLLGLPFFRFLETIGSDAYYLQGIAVAEAARGRGVGSRLIEHIEEQARVAGTNRLTLHVAIENEGAQRLYRRHGFVEEARSARLLCLPETEVLRMSKPL